MNDTSSPQRNSDGVVSVAAGRGPLAMEAVSLGKDFRLGRGDVLHAVRGVSFGLYRGAVVALVGESGSGKSTAARLLAGQERPTSGSIRLGGVPVDVSSRHMRLSSPPSTATTGADGGPRSNARATAEARSTGSTVEAPPPGARTHSCPLTGASGVGGGTGRAPFSGRRGRVATI